MLDIASIKKLLLNKFAKDSVWVVSSHFLVGISGLAINTIIGLNYHAAGLGIFNQSLAIYMLAVIIANAGIQTSVQKHIAQFSDEILIIKQVFYASLLATVVTSLLLTIFGYMLVVYYVDNIVDSKILDILKLMFFAVPLFAVNKTINNFYVGLRKINIYSSIRVTRWLLIISGIFIFSINNNPLGEIGYIFIGVELLLLLLLLTVSRKYIDIFNASAAWIVRHIKFGLKSIVTELTATLNSAAPVLIIGSVVGNAAAGYFSFYEVFAKSILMISSAFQTNFNPIFTKLWFTSDKSKIVLKINKLLKVQAYLLAPIILFVTISGYFYTYYFMSADYLQYYYLLILYLLGSSVVYLYGPYAGMLIMSEHLLLNFFRALVFLVTHVIMLFYLVNINGLAGAPIAFFVATIVNLAMYVLIYSRVLDLKLNRSDYER